MHTISIYYAAISDLCISAINISMRNEWRYIIVAYIFIYIDKKMSCVLRDLNSIKYNTALNLFFHFQNQGRYENEMKYRQNEAKRKKIWLIWLKRWYFVCFGFVLEFNIEGTTHGSEQFFKNAHAG